MKTLSLDSWYKGVMYLGVAVLAISFFIDVKGITNSQLQLLAAGTFMIGLGEWKNHKVESGIKPANASVGDPVLMSTSIRRPDPIGIFLEWIGVLILIAGLWFIVSS